MVCELAVRQRRPTATACVVMCAVAMTGCSGGERSARVEQRPRAQTLGAANDPPRLASAAPQRTAGTDSPGTYKLGKPYQIRGRWYVPTEDPNYDRSGVASWYGPDFHGKKTANGETFDMHGLTAAHTTLPLPSYVYVTNLANGRTLLLRVNDRGPYVPGRILDLSRGAARLLGTEPNGIGHVRVRYAGRAPLDGNPEAERRFLAEQPWYGLNGRMSLGATPAPVR